jgi:DNA-binding NtrC family response regulator
MKEQTLLIVDDEPSFLNSVSRILRLEQYRILTADSGSNALELVRNNEISVVVSDYRMPGMDGLSLLRKIRLEQPHAVQIILTAVPDVHIAIEALNELGIFKFLLKPIQFESFKQTIKQAMEASRANLAPHSPPEFARPRDIVLRELEKDFPGITSIPPRDKEGYYLIEE